MRNWSQSTAEASKSSTRQTRIGFRVMLDVRVQVHRLSSGGGDDQTRGEFRLTQHPHERRHVVPGQRRRRRIELALDGDQIAAASIACHEIDAGIRLAVATGPVHPRPDLIEVVTGRLVELEERVAELLEAPPLRGERLRRFVELVQELTECRHRHRRAPPPPTSSGQPYAATALKRSGPMRCSRRMRTGLQR